MSDASSPMRMVTRKTARLVFEFHLPSQIARLFLYLFGEFDKDTVDAIHKTIQSEGTVVEDFLDKKAPPLRLLYEELILKGLIERQVLPAHVELFIDLPDELQLRISSEEGPTPPAYVPEDHPEEP